MTYRLGELRWNDRPPFSRIEDPPAFDPGVHAAEVLTSIEHERDGGPLSTSEFDREWILRNVETSSQLDRYFAGLPRTDLVLSRLRSFMRSLCRTPARVLEPVEAVELAKAHMDELQAVGCRNLSSRSHLSREIIETASSYLDTLRSLDPLGERNNSDRCGNGIRLGTNETLR